MNIFRVPVDTEHFKDTIEKGKAYDLLEKFLTDADRKNVVQMSNEGILRYWGSIAGDSNQRTFAHLQEGDEILFYRNKKYIGVAKIGCKVINPALARYSWGERKDGFTWELVYFLKDVQLISIGRKVINKAFGFPKEDGPVMGFSMVEEKKASKFLKENTSVAKFIEGLE